MEPMPTLPDDTDVVLVFSTNCDCEKGLSVVANLPSASVPVTQIMVGLCVEDEEVDDDDEEEEESAAKTALKRAKNQIKKKFMMSRM